MSARTSLAVAFGKVVCELRGNMPQVALASFAGIDLNRLALLEAGADEPALEEVFRLARVLDLKASELIERVVNTAGGEAP